MNNLPFFPDLKNKNIIITGGHGFLGKQHAEAFAKNGSNIIVLDISKNLKFEQYIKKMGVKYLFFNCNITNKQKLVGINKYLKKKKKLK